jgi:ubiquinone biosynthesis UbiH/UbiF/VisC/COQ6 family hydroxylase
MSAAFDVVVVGAGPIGLCTALLLVRQAGIAPARIAVLDRRIPPPADPRQLPVDLRVFALSRASEKILRACDAWADVLAARANPYERMQVWHADVPPHGGDALVFDAAEIGERDLGVIAENSVLQAALAAAARRAGMVLQQGELESLAVERDAAVLTANGQTLRARLVVGADGAQSRVRELAGVFATRTDYGQVAIVAMVNTAKPHQNTAWQRFLGDGTLAFLPLLDGQSSIVWSLPTARAAKLLACAPPDFERELDTDFDAALGKSRLTSERLQFPLWRLDAEDYVTERVALVGDAAHVVHPLAGQGLNLGLADVQVLADTLQQREPWRSLSDGRLLQRYARARAWPVWAMSRLTDALVHGFASREGWQRELRNRGMGLVDRATPLKRWLAAQALEG